MIYDYCQIKQVKLIINLSIRYTSTTIFYFDNHKRENVELDRYQALSIFNFLRSKGVKVLSNNMAYKKSLE